jgi:cytochrome c-type biogenesis protein CcmH
MRIALVLLVGLAAAAPATAAEPRTSLPDIEDEVMCPICGTLLQLSDSPQAERERELIRRLIAEGRSKDEVKEALVAEYGEDVLATPDTEGLDLIAWVLPALGGLMGIAVLGIALARMRRMPSGTEAKPLDPADAARLDRDISSHDL